MVIDGERVTRRLDRQASALFDQLFQDGRLAELVARSLLIPTKQYLFDEARDGFEQEGLVHELVAPFSYPWEWSFEMRRSAALATLRLMQNCLEMGLILKDGAALNLAYHKGRMVWIDVLSLMPAPERGYWLGYNQFCCTQLYPLLVEAHTGVDPRGLLYAQPEGISVDQARAIIGGMRVWKPGVFKHVTLPGFLERRLDSGDVSLAAELQDQKKSGWSLKNRGISPEIILEIVRSLEKLVSRLSAPRSNSIWLNYETNKFYSQDEGAEKKALVEEFVRRERPSTLVDLGCNAGEYTILSAPIADCVLAIDSDRSAIDRLLSRPIDDESRAKISPFVSDLAAPAMGHGWCGAESAPFLERIRGDAFICLALIHHLCIGKNLPITKIVDWLRFISPSGLIEWIDKTDPMVRFMLRNREDIFRDYSEENFRMALKNRFSEVQPIDLSIGTRRLYRVSDGR